MTAGGPKRQIQCLKKHLATVAPLVFKIGTVIRKRDFKSITVSSELIRLFKSKFNDTIISKGKTIERPMECIYSRAFEL